MLCCRPVSKEVLSKMSFPKVKNVWSVDGKLGGWDQLQQKFFDDKVSISLRTKNMPYQPGSAPPGKCFQMQSYVHCQPNFESA